MTHADHLIQASRKDVERFMRYVVVLQSGCWLWIGARSRGAGKKGQKVWYGSFRVGHRTVRAHRFASEVLGRQHCPDGHHRDHKCELSLCVNPDCIEVVPKSVNQERKVARLSEGRYKAALASALRMYDEQEPT